MNKRISILSIEHPFERLLLRALLVIFVGLIFAYLYFVGASILHIIARKDALTQSAAISTAIGNHERDYFALSKNLTAESGGQFGLRPVGEVAYVNRPGTLGLADGALENGI
ncbi:MAG: hypothetical protein UY63_C0001G0015 [Parcubacteria group bacterium GW2011_GWA2_51_10]|nr:MAG: hypothetical protein UY63_C0001G0015 [Parcubacteria group bacterium GW2011_GWA2_51_10]